MAFETPTLDECAAFLVAHFQALFPDDDVSATSFNFLWTLTLAAAVTDNHAHIDAVKNDLIPDTSEGATLERWATIRGVTKKGATPARKAKALRVVGVPGTNVPTLAELKHDASGLLFKTSSAGVVGAGTYVDVDVVGISVGTLTRLDAGQVLRFTALPHPDLEEEAELQLDLDEDGEDQESDGALRLRVLSRFSNPPLGGAQEDYVQWALEELGIAAAFAYPLRQGLGSVDLAALHAGSGTARSLLEPERAELQAKIDEKRPVSVKAFRVLTTTAQEVDIEVTIVPNGEAQFGFDWDDSTPPTVNSYNAGTRKVTLDLDRPATMKAGDRVSFKNLAGAGTGKERIIESLDGTAAFVLEADELGDTPAATDVVYSGGPLVQPARAAIQALVDSLGTANPDAKRYGAWEGNLDPDSVLAAARSIAGVLRGTTVDPVAIVEALDPPFPDDDEVGLVIAGRILVRKQP